MELRQGRAVGKGKIPDALKGFGKTDGPQLMAAGKGALPDGADALAQLHLLQGVAVGEGPRADLAAASRANDDPLQRAVFQRNIAAEGRFADGLDTAGNVHALHISAVIKGLSADTGHAFLNHHIPDLALAGQPGRARVAVCVGKVMHGSGTPDSQGPRAVQNGGHAAGGSAVALAAVPGLRSFPRFRVPGFLRRSGNAVLRFLREGGPRQRRQRQNRRQKQGQDLPSDTHCTRFLLLSKIGRSPAASIIPLFSQTRKLLFPRRPAVRTPGPAGGAENGRSPPARAGGPLMKSNHRFRGAYRPTSTTRITPLMSAYRFALSA